MTEARRIVILGGGGHARVVVDLVELSGAGCIVGILDDDPEKHGTSCAGYPVLGGRQALAELLTTGPLHGIVAIGDNRVRKAAAEYFVCAGGSLLQAIHPRASVARSARIGVGSVVMAGAIVNADAIVGANVIVNTAAVVEHDVVIEDHVHLAPTAALCGGVSVGEGTLVGVGAKVVPDVKVGRWSMIGAGAVVLGAVADDAIAVGVPARNGDREIDTR